MVATAAQSASFASSSSAAATAATAAATAAVIVVSASASHAQPHSRRGALISASGVQHSSAAGALASSSSGRAGAASVAAAGRNGVAGSPQPLLDAGAATGAGGACDPSSATTDLVVGRERVVQGGNGAETAKLAGLGSRSPLSVFSPRSPRGYRRGCCPRGRRRLSRPLEVPPRRAGSDRPTRTRARSRWSMRPSLRQ